jgi:hypothetical protein
MARKYPYYPAWDGKKASPLILKVAELSLKRWPKTVNLGTYVNRDIRGKPGEKSVHATGYALDLGYTDEKQARIIWDYFLGYSKELGICEVHWYKYGTYGAGYRCSRGENKAGVKIFTATDNAGPGGKWLHLEIDHLFGGVKGGDVARWEEVFRSLRPS